MAYGDFNATFDSEAVTEKGRVLKNHLSLHCLCKSLRKTSFLPKDLSSCGPVCTTLLFNNTSSNLPDLIVYLTWWWQVSCTRSCPCFHALHSSMLLKLCELNTLPLQAHVVASLVHLYTEEESELWESLGLCLDR